MLLNPNYEYIDKSQDLIKLNFKCPECQENDFKPIELEFTTDTNRIYDINLINDYWREKENNKQHHIIISLLCNNCHNIFNIMFN